MRLIAVLAAACALFGQPAGQKPGSIRGSVVTTAGEPVRKAEVTITTGRADSMQRTMTDPSGAFAFEGLQPGTYQVLAQRNGFVGATAGARSAARSAGIAVAVGPGQDVTGVSIRMMPHGVIAGKVIDEDGEPLASVNVQILRERWANGRRQLMPMNMDSTNDLGEYRIAGLAPGRYFLIANYDRMHSGVRQRTGDAASDMVYVAMYYPGVPEVAQAAPVVVAPGQVSPADFRLSRQPAFRIRGTVVDEAGRPLQGVQVMAAPGEGSMVPRAMTVARGADGAFEISGITPGTHVLVANRPRMGGGHGSVRLTVHVGNRDLDGVQLVVTPGFEISGSIRLPEGVALGAARVMLEPLDSGTFMPAQSGAIDAGKGTWTITGVSAGRYRFSVVGLPQGVYIKSVVAGGQDVSAGAYISAPATGVEVDIAGNAPSIRGTVVDADGRPVPSATVVMMPPASLRDRPWLYRFVTSDQRGGFSLGTMSPGDYSVFAFREIEEGIWYSPDFSAQVQGKGTAVKAAEGAAENIQVVVQ